MARHFAAVRWRPPPQEPEASGLPTIFVANHSSWWDGFLAYLVGRGLGTSFQVLMEARHLARYPFFRRVGALPVDRDIHARAYADLERAGDALRPGTGLWIFPQGERRPAPEPVYALEAGAAHLALQARGPVVIRPVAFRYAFWSEQLPEAVAWVGEAWVLEDPTRDRRSVTREIGHRLRGTLATLDAAMASEHVRELRLLVPGRLSLNKRLDRVRHRLGLLSGTWEERNG